MLRAGEHSGGRLYVAWEGKETTSLSVRVATL